MTSREFAEKAIAHFNKQITNEVFLAIQKDRQLMHDYLRTVARRGLDSVNQAIGREVKKAYHLANSNREKNPSCTLIQTHQKFKSSKSNP